MRQADDVRVWVVTGALGAMLLGIALIPLRSLTSASNLAFAFLALTIVVAELGGRAPALATALTSAMSLDFFLTEPYLKLTINKPDDIVAFAALAACGLIAAAFGTRRERWSELAGRAGAELDVVKTLIAQLRAGAALDDVLETLRSAFGLDALALRDEGERILAAACADLMPSAAPETRLDPETLMPADESHLRFGARGLRLPAGGGRLRLPSDGGIAFLDLWEGDPRGFGGYETRALSITAAILGFELARRRIGPARTA